MEVSHESWRVQMSGGRSAPGGRVCNERFAFDRATAYKARA